ncbi:MAG: polysaccharide pyruvyl transferase family protein [Saprospiraceae bacterium]
MKTRITRVAIHGAARNFNYGDILLMSLYKQLLEKMGYEVLFDKANEYYGNFLNIKPNIGALRLVTSCDCLIYAGGGYFGEPNKPSIRWYSKLLYYHLWIGILFKLFNKPYSIIGAGFGPITNLIIRKIVLYVFNGADIVSVRDDESATYLKVYGVKKFIYVIPDLALTIGLNHHKNDNLQAGKRRLLLHVPLDNSNHFEKMCNLVASIYSRYKNKMLINFIIDHGIGENSAQSIFYKKLMDKIKIKINIICFNNPNETIELLKSAEIILTTKLHMAITSYALGVMPIGISKHQKTIRFFKQINLEHLTFSLDSFSEKQVLLAIQQYKTHKLPNIKYLKWADLNRNLISNFIQTCPKKVKPEN